LASRQDGWNPSVGLSKVFTVVSVLLPVSPVSSPSCFCKQNGRSLRSRQRLRSVVARASNDDNPGVGRYWIRPSSSTLAAIAWFLRSSASDLRMTRPRSHSPAHRSAFRSTSSRVGAGRHPVLAPKCRCPSASLPEVLVPFDALHGGCVPDGFHTTSAFPSDRFRSPLGPAGLLRAGLVLRCPFLDPMGSSTCAGFFRPLRVSPPHLPGLFHPGGILGVLPFRGMFAS
jgi:hypothetical protein